MSTPATLTAIFFGATDRYRSRPAALRAKREGRWQPISYADLYDRVHAASAGLLDLGLVPGDRVAILSENRPEWAIIDYACLAARCADVSVYATLPAKQVEYILRDSGAVAVCVSTRAQLDKIQAIRPTLPALQHVIAFEPELHGPEVIGFDALLSRGRAARGKWPKWREEALQVRPDDLATLIYTSGTTGDPKGVMLTHGNITSNVVASIPCLTVTDRDECLSLLPLSHIFERMAGHYLMFEAGVVINYAEGFDAVSANLLEVRPTICCAVPRLYEKIYARALEAASTGSRITRKIFFWARRVGEQWTGLRLEGKAIPIDLKFARLVADRLVFSKLRARVGGRLRFFISGGAPLSPEIARFFYAAGLPILEGYGLTETSPVIAVNTPDHLKIGTVGRPIPGVEVKIAADGEILTRGPHVMKGYYKKPEATAEVIEKDGWFHTGDVGVIDKDGFLVITDRKKDILITSGGKNIAPQPIESRLKTNPFFAEVVMIGNRRHFPSALVVPSFEALEKWARAQGLAFRNREELVAKPEVVGHYQELVAELTTEFAQFEKIKKVSLLAREFSLEAGELTPTLKVKRRVVEERYKVLIDKMYEGVV